MQQNLGQNLGNSETGSKPDEVPNQGRRRFIQIVSTALLLPDKLAGHTMSSLLEAPTAAPAVFSSAAYGNFINYVGFVSGFRRNFWDDKKKEELMEDFLSKLRDDGQFRSILSKFKDELPNLNSKIRELMQAEATRLHDKYAMAGDQFNAAIQTHFDKLKDLELPKDVLLANSRGWKEFFCDYHDICRKFDVDPGQFGYEEEVLYLAKNFLAEMTSDLCGWGGFGISRPGKLKFTSANEGLFYLFESFSVGSDSSDVGSIAKMICEPDFASRFVAAEKRRLKPSQEVNEITDAAEKRQVNPGGGDGIDSGKSDHLTDASPSGETAGSSFAGSPVLKITLSGAEGEISAQVSYDQLKEIFEAIKELRELNLEMISESAADTGPIARDLQASAVVAVVSLASITHGKLGWEAGDVKSECDLDENSVAVIMLDRVDSLNLELAKVGYAGIDPLPQACVRFFECKTASLST